MVRGGVMSLWTGLEASLYRSVPGVAFYMTSVTLLRSMLPAHRFLNSGHASLLANDPLPFRRKDAIVVFACGFSARVLSVVALAPFSVVKTRVEVLYSHFDSND